MPLFLATRASASSGFASIGVVFILLVVIFVFLFIVALIGCLFRTAKATEKTHETLERILKIVDAVARKEHPELYGKSSEEAETKTTEDQNS